MMQQHNFRIFVRDDESMEDAIKRYQTIYMVSSSARKLEQLPKGVVGAALIIRCLKTLGQEYTIFIKDKCVGKDQDYTNRGQFSGYFFWGEISFDEDCTIFQQWLLSGLISKDEYHYIVA